MRINFVLQQNDGSHYYRMKLPCEALRNQGMDAKVVPTGVDVRDADIWVLNRPISLKAVQVIAELRESGRAVVVDVDDNFGAIRPAHALFNRAAEYHANLTLACKEASLVTCATQGLLDVYGSGHGVVIPNFVPEWYLSIKPEPHEGTWVGWAGTRHSHPGNLEETQGQVARAVQDNGAGLAYVGPRELAHEVAGALKYRHPVKTSGWRRISDYPNALAEFDIGIAPLCSTTFDECKSFLKGAEYASVGVPFVASPTGPYRELHSHGVGILAARPKDWYREISRLIKESSLRSDLAEQFRENMRPLTIEANADRWASALTNCRLSGSPAL